jgi:hypothetical protein
MGEAAEAKSTNQKVGVYLGLRRDGGDFAKSSSSDTTTQQTKILDSISPISMRQHSIL